jgi:hypothetical protein
VNAVAVQAARDVVARALEQLAAHHQPGALRAQVVDELAATVGALLLLVEELDLGALFDAQAHGVDVATAAAVMAAADAYHRHLGPPAGTMGEVLDRMARDTARIAALTSASDR